MDQKVLEVSSLSLSFSDYLPTYLSSMYLSIYLAIYLSLSLFHLITYLPIYPSTYLSHYLPIYLIIYLSIYLPTYLSIYLYEFDRGSFDVDVGELKLEKKVTKRWSAKPGKNVKKTWPDRQPRRERQPKGETNRESKRTSKTACTGKCRSSKWIGNKTRVSAQLWWALGPRNFMCLIVLWHPSKSLADMFDAGHESVIARFCVLVCCRF